MANFSNLNADTKLVPDGTMPLLFLVSQYDAGRILNVHFTDQGEDWSIPDGYTATLKAIKADGNLYTEKLSTTSSYAQIVTDEQLTACAGSVICEIRFSDDSGTDIGSANFIIGVEKSPIDGATVSDTYLGEVQTAITELAQQIYDSTSALNALVSAAAASESNAASSATAAANSATSAATCANSASNSASSAASSANGAASSATAAANSASEASSSASSAASYANAAANSASSAATSANTATSEASAASTSANSAASSANSASSSANSAAASESNAAASAEAAAAYLATLESLGFYVDDDGYLCQFV